MNTIKRLTVWMMGCAVMPCFIIVVWLFSFMSFELLPVLRDEFVMNINIVIALIWGYVSIIMPISDIDNIIS